MTNTSHSFCNFDTKRLLQVLVTLYDKVYVTDVSWSCEARIEYPIYIGQKECQVVKEGDYLKLDTPNFTRLYTDAGLSLNLKCDQETLHKILYWESNQINQKIRNKKVEDCTTKELLLAVSVKLNEQNE